MLNQYLCRIKTQGTTVTWCMVGYAFISPAHCGLETKEMRLEAWKKKNQSRLLKNILTPVTCFGCDCYDGNGEGFKNAPGVPGC